LTNRHFCGIVKEYIYYFADIGIFMKSYDLVTPAGTSDLLPLEVKRLRAAEKALSTLFEANGFSEIATTELEFMDVFNLKSRHFPSEGLYKAIDDKGRLLALRPDSTMPIARLAASRLRVFSSLKLYYNQKVYRNSPGARRRNDELRQMGVELIGEAAGADSDIQTAKLALDVLGLLPDSTKCILEIGDIGITKLLLELLPVSVQVKEQLRNAVETKNSPELEDILSGINCEDSLKHSLLKLPTLYGNEAVFDKAFALFTDSAVLDRITKLHDFFKSLQEKNNRKNTTITVDFGCANKMDYYTGTVIRGYIENAGEAVINGGRYDNLLSEFDESTDKPAIGFAVNMDIFAANLQADKVTGTEHKLRIALTKGRLEKKAVELFESIGFDCTEIHEKGRRLILCVTREDLSFEVVLAKPNDVITYVESGVCDLGIVGKDTILEDGGKFFEVLDLGFGKCRFAVAGKKGQKDHTAIKTIATKYPKVARDFYDGRGADIDIVKIEGSVELAPLLGLSDAIVDIVETGSTLVENGLEVYEDIVNLSARLIANRVSLKMYRSDLRRLFKDIISKLKD
jgi:ATP phosphoribosyltransferase regulatory subunit